MQENLMNFFRRQENSVNYPSSDEIIELLIYLLICLSLLTHSGDIWNQNQFNMICV
jgi:hypothetical protein